jgi:hypothetical protein
MMNRYLAPLLLALLCSTHAFSATILLKSDGTGAYPTIQEAISASVDGDVIELADGTYTGTGNRDVYFFGKAVTVRSESGNPVSCIIDCQGAVGDYHRAFNFLNNEQSQSVLQNLTITGGYMYDRSGAVAMEDASPTLTGCIFLNNSSAGRGGAIICYDSSPTLNSCIFRGNTGDFGGAMMCSNPSTPFLTGCIFEDNTADVAGAFGSSSSCTPILENCLFINNVANGFGGAMYFGNARPNITNCTFVGNTAGYFASCIGGSFPALPATINNSIFAFNAHGDPIWCEDGPAPVFSCCDIFGNESGDWVGHIADQMSVNGNLSVDPVFCDRQNGDLTLELESVCLPQNNSCGVLMGALPEGCCITAVPEGGASTHAVAINCFPNPFNPRINISLTLGDPQSVELCILDMTGRRVSVLANGMFGTGIHTFTWQGNDSQGRLLASGNYLVQLKTEESVHSEKVSLIR